MDYTPTITVRALELISAAIRSETEACKAIESRNGDSAQRWSHVDRLTARRDRIINRATARR